MSEAASAYAFTLQLCIPGEPDLLLSVSILLRSDASLSMDQESTTNMPVSMICFTELLGTTIPSEFLDKLDQLIDSQDEAVATYEENHSAASSLTSHRGMVLFQQIEDPRIIMGSGQWPCSAVCADWFDSEQGVQFISDMEPFHRPEAMDFAVVEGFIFPDATPDAAPSLIDALQIEVTRWRVPSEQQDRFNSAFDALQRQRMQSDLQCSIFSSWGLDDWPPRPDSETVKEFFMIACCSELEPPEARGTGDIYGHLSKEEAVCKGLSITVEKRHYAKAL
jgi:hypothetical protein